VENRWRKARGGGDLMSFKHMIAGAVEGGLDPDCLWTTIQHKFPGTLPKYHGSNCGTA
jgi:hypothetical protein